jgi:hypothetical protein
MNTTTSERPAGQVTFRLAVVALLTGVFVIQVLILLRPVPPIQPTFGDWRNAASSEDRKMLIDRIPLVKINGEVDVEVTNKFLKVAVENEPLDVKIVR